MSARKATYVATLVLVIASVAFILGSYNAQRHAAQQAAANDAKIAALRSELIESITAIRQGKVPRVAGTAGHDTTFASVQPEGGNREIVNEIKRELQSEMGLLPLQLLRDRRESFVELYSYDNLGASNYGTAGYLGDGYFVTVKHGVVALGQDTADAADARRVVSIKLMYRGKALRASLVDSGDAEVEVDKGDWAVIKVHEPVDLPPLRLDLDFSYDFAEPILRLGNDYSKGIILSTGYVGQRTTAGLVTCLTDGHPGVSGGGVLNQRGNLVGIPIGRMQGDYRFSFILPLRREMFRKLPNILSSALPDDVVTD